MKTMAKKRTTIPAFTAPHDQTLFIFEKGDVLIFGATETAIPVSDLEAFLKHCDEEVLASNPATTPEPPEE